MKAVKSKVDIEEEIKKIIKKSRRPMSASEVQKELKRRGIKISYAWTKSKLDSLVSEGRIARLRRGRRDFYGNRDIIVTLDRYIQYETADQAEKEYIKKDLEVEELVVFEEALKPWLDIIDLWRDKIEPVLVKDNNLVKFTSTKPSRFFFELIKRAVYISQELHRRFISESNIKIRWRIRHRSIVLKKALLRLCSYLGLPKIVLDFEAKKGTVLVNIPDYEILEMMIEESIVGEEMISVVRHLDAMAKEYEKDTFASLVSAGVDGTRFIVPPWLFIRLFRPATPLLESPPIYVHAAVSSWLDVAEGELKACDPRPLPEDWADYKRPKAEEEGLIVTPASLQDMNPALWKRAGEAALDAVEYRKLEEAFWPPKDVLGTDLRYSAARPLIVFLDGRIFPYEFRIDDYLHDHGKFVQAAFANLVKVMGSNDIYNPPGNPRTLICGVVKRSGLNVFRIVLSFWLFMQGLIGEDDFWRIMEAPLPDGYLLWKIFSLIRRQGELGSSESELLVTFRIRKPFFSMVQEVTLLKDVTALGRTAKEKIEGLSNLSVWEDALREFARESRMPEVNVGPYAVACTSAFILHFYCDAPHLSPLRGDVILPRFEVLIPYRIPRRRSDLLLFDESVLGRMNYLFGRLKNWFVFYKIYEERGERESRLLVPREVNSAHEWANELGREYKTTIVGLLEEAFIRLLTRNSSIHSRRKPPTS